MQFEKVSYDEWIKSCTEIFKDIYNINNNTFQSIIDKAYNEIKLPTRSTESSAGYDFYNPFEVINIFPYQIYKIPTGIRWTGEDCNGKVLLMLPRSGFGCKYGFKLRNTVGVIDADYQNATNEGHIQLIFQADDKCVIGHNKAIAQGIIVNYFTVDNDNVHAKRTGGFGSTDIK